MSTMVGAAKASLEAASPFELRVDQGKGVSEPDVRAALKSGDMGFLHSLHDRFGGGRSRHSPRRVDDARACSAASIATTPTPGRSRTAFR